MNCLARRNYLDRGDASTESWPTTLSINWRRIRPFIREASCWTNKRSGDWLCRLSVSCRSYSRRSRSSRSCQRSQPKRNRIGR